jgi:hypothetical protein
MFWVPFPLEVYDGAIFGAVFNDIFSWIEGLNDEMLSDFRVTEWVNWNMRLPL